MRWTITIAFKARWITLAVKIRLFSYLRESAGSSEIVIEDLSFPCQFKDIIQYLIDQHPHLKPHLMAEENLFSNEIHILINGQSITDGSKGVLSYLVKDGDEIVMLPPVGGG